MTVLNTSTVLNRRSLLLGAALAGTTGLLAACSGGNGSSAGSTQSASNLLESIKSAGKIRIGVEGTYRPYTYHDASGKLAGFEYDIAETLAKDLGVTAEYIETPWDSLIAGVDAGRYDIVLNNVAPTEERKKKYDFSVPYAHSRARVGVKKDSSLKNASEISGHSAAQSATSNYRKLVEERGATIIEVTGFDEAIEQVLTGFPEIATQYQIILTTRGPLDHVELRVETVPEFPFDEIRKLEALKKRLATELKGNLQIAVDIKLVEPKSIERSEGKAKRIIDLRKE